ncbi:hypothetical protein BUALT_Bualt03G0194400 [Buddleja alternifolia]|uniref:Pyruvate kinase n=1 Tax=Buddleja alternifolia TaxID=168488 RepID=A0AAV6Y604_9LAMI|nr:hypothetical protein BUALT_Bualt03G0194400 [Buddleja alternifolia]
MVTPLRATRKENGSTSGGQIKNPTVSNTGTRMKEGVKELGCGLNPMIAKNGKSNHHPNSVGRELVQGDATKSYILMTVSGCDAVLLGFETLHGLYPVETISSVGGICAEAEKVFNSVQYFKSSVEFVSEPMSHLESIASSSAR